MVGLKETITYSPTTTYSPLESDHGGIESKKYLKLSVMLAELESDHGGIES